MDHDANTVRPTTTSLLRELDDLLALAAETLDGAAPAVDPARGCLQRAQEVVARLRELDDSSTAPHVDTLALVRRLELPAQRASARKARAFAGQTCEQWGLPVPVRSAAVDVASELVANAAAHGTGPVVLVLERGAGLLVRVWDDGPGLPRLLPYRPGLSEKGLGLRLVRQLSSHWGAAPQEDGKWVWARIELPDGDGS